MTRKDYILIADAIKAAHDHIVADLDPNETGWEQLRGVRRTAAHIADALGRDNPRFDQGRFLITCGYGAEPETIAKKTDNEHYRLEQDAEGDWGIRALSVAMQAAMLGRGYVADRETPGFFPFSLGKKSAGDVAENIVKRCIVD